MNDKPRHKDDPGDQKRFERAIKNELATPPKRHKSKSNDQGIAPDGREPDPNNPESGVGRDPE